MSEVLSKGPCDPFALCVSSDVATHNVIGTRLQANTTIAANSIILFPRATLAADVTDYWTTNIGYYRPGTGFVSIASVTTATTGYTALTARTVTHSAVNLKVGDIVMLVNTINGTPAGPLQGLTAFYPAT